MRSFEDSVRPTTLVYAQRLSARLGVNLVLATETFQCTGSFKFRAAFNLASKVPETHLITASSGNFGQALAYACSLLNKTCHVVMPSTSSRIKMEAVREYGGIVDVVRIEEKSRAERVAELACEYPEAYIASAYDDEYVIEGNESLAAELKLLNLGLESVIVPVGGGGLASGVVRGFQGSGISIYGAEPQLANDAARSLRTGTLVFNETEPQTLADGARTVSLGVRNWAILQHGLSDIFEVGESLIGESLRSLFLYANLKCEPTGALAVAALMQNKERFSGQKVCCIVSGGNVDPETYASLVREAPDTL